MIIEQQAKKDTDTPQDHSLISPAELAKALKNDPPPRLIDVRGDEERHIVTIDGDLPATKERIEEIQSSWSKDTPIVMYCHHGIRSIDAASFLKNQGFTNVKSLQGGIDAWAIEIDPSLPRY